MSNIINSIDNMRLLDDLAREETFIHRIHPLAKLLTTAIYLAVVISFGKYEVIGLLPFVFYPVLIFALAEIPVRPILKRVLIIEPFIIGIGILNPLFDHYTVNVAGHTVSAGWLTFLSILIKSSFTIITSILLIATTGIERLAVALRMLKIPKAFVLQLLLTYRYITVLIEEIARMIRAYLLRAPGQKGVHWSVWGSFAGQLILRTFERAQRVYQAMNLRGFTGEYNVGGIAKFSFNDIIYLVVWSLFFIIARIYNMPALIGLLFTGVINR